MASKTKQEKGAKQENNSPENLLDALTKEEKEALLNKKMEEIRKRNEERQRRYAEIEADRKAAEQMGRAVSLKPTSPEADGTINRPKASDCNQTKPERRKSDGKSRSTSYRAEARNRDDQTRDAWSKKSDTSNKVESNMSFNRKRQNEEQNKPTTKQNTMKGVRDKDAPHIRSMGRGKRLTQMSHQKLKAEEYDKSKQDATAESDSKKTPPPDPGYKFLADPRREKSLPESSRGESIRRHPRNFGGTNFDNVKNKIKAEKEKYGRFQSGPLQTELDMTLQMTGRERREYVQWRAERERIDKERLQRQKSAEGMWKREWDVGKKEQSPPTPPMSRKMEPGRRPAGRIGSGRFAAGEPDERPGKGQRDDPGSNRGRAKRGRDTAAIWSRGRGSESYQGRGRSRGSRQSHSSSDSIENTEGISQPELSRIKQENTERSPKRFRLSSQGSDDSSRHVKHQNDKLVIQIDNEFASSKSPTSEKKPFSDFGDSQGKDFTFQPLNSSSDPVEFDGFHGKPSPQGDYRGGGRGGRGRGRGERRRSVDRKGGRSGKPGRGKTVTFQTQPLVHTPDLEWDPDPEMKENGRPKSDWKQDLEEASAQNWNVSEDAAKSWELDAAVGIAECDGEYMEDHYIMGHEETYPEMKKKRGKPKKRKAKILPKPKPKEITGFVDENGEPIDEKDGEWLDEEELVTNQVEDDGEVADNELHDSSAESLERFIQEHTLQLSIDAKTGDISLENSLPNSQQSGASEQSPHHQPAPLQEPPSSQDLQPPFKAQRNTSSSQTPVKQKDKTVTQHIQQPLENSGVSQDQHLDTEPELKPEENFLDLRHEDLTDNSQKPSVESLQNVADVSADSSDDKSDKMQETDVKDEELHEGESVFKKAESLNEDEAVTKAGGDLNEEQPLSEMTEMVHKDQAVSGMAQALNEDGGVTEVDEVCHDTDTQASDKKDQNDVTSSSKDTETTDVDHETDETKDTSSGLEKCTPDDTLKSDINKPGNTGTASDGAGLSATDVVCENGAKEWTTEIDKPEVRTEEKYNHVQQNVQVSYVPPVEDDHCPGNTGNNEEIKDITVTKNNVDHGTNQLMASNKADEHTDDTNGKDGSDQQQPEINTDGSPQQTVSNNREVIPEADMKSVVEATSKEAEPTPEFHEEKTSIEAFSDSTEECKIGPMESECVQQTPDQSASLELHPPATANGDMSHQTSDEATSSEKFKLPESNNQLDVEAGHDEDVVKQSVDERAETNEGQIPAPMES